MGMCLPCLGGAGEDAVETPDPVSFLCKDGNVRLCIEHFYLTEDRPTPLHIITPVTSHLSFLSYKSYPVCYSLWGGPKIQLDISQGRAIESTRQFSMCFLFLLVTCYAYPNC